MLLLKINSHRENILFDELNGIPKLSAKGRADALAILIGEVDLKLGV